MSVQSSVRGLTVVVMMCLATPIYAQNPPDTPPSSDARFLAIDLTGGYLRFPPETSPTSEAPGGSEGKGWHIGTTIRPQTWWGMTGEFGHTTDDAHRGITQYLGGVRLNSPYGTEAAARVFAHALGGGVTVRDVTGSHTGPQFVAGAGFDMLFFLRAHADYALSNVTGLPTHSSRAFVGAVVPLCLKGCREGSFDGFPISHQRSRNWRPSMSSSPSLEQRQNK